MIMCFPTKSIVFIFERMKQSDELLYITIVAKKNWDRFNAREEEDEKETLIFIRLKFWNKTQIIEASIV